jgi:hypothetical protein
MKRALLVTASAMALAVGGEGLASAQAVPTITGVSVCTADEPFAVEAHASGFEPNTRFGFKAEFASGGTVGTNFTTDGMGDATIGTVLATAPFTVTVTVWRQFDMDFDQDPNEPTILTGTAVIDRPCTGTVIVGRPTTVEQCKSGGWRQYGVFRNQGDCVSFVATGGRNQPANPPT